MRRIFVSLALCLGLILPATAAVVTVTAVTSSQPAFADHQGACWEVWDFVHREWTYQSWNGGWWVNGRYDVYRECEGHPYGEYLGRYSGGWYRCYCQPYWYDTSNDVFY